MSSRLLDIGIRRFEFIRKSWEFLCCFLVWLSDNFGLSISFGLLTKSQKANECQSSVINEMQHLKQLPKLPVFACASSNMNKECKCRCRHSVTQLVMCRKQTTIVSFKVGPPVVLAIYFPLMHHSVDLHLTR